MFFAISSLSLRHTDTLSHTLLKSTKDSEDRKKDVALFSFSPFPLHSFLYPNLSTSKYVRSTSPLASIYNHV